VGTAEAGAGAELLGAWKEVVCDWEVAISAGPELDTTDPIVTSEHIINLAQLVFERVVTVKNHLNSASFCRVHAALRTVV
jgi:hypothetical protein